MSSADRFNDAESGNAALVSLSEGETNKLKPLTSGSSRSTPARASERNPVFDVLFLAETGSVYQPGDYRSIPRNMVGRLNRATADAKDVGYTADELMRGIEAWPRLMGARVNITAMALVTNMPRLQHVAAGGSFHGADNTAEGYMQRKIARRGGAA